MHNYNMSNMSGMQKSAANKLLCKGNNIPMPMLQKENNTYAHEKVNYFTMKSTKVQTLSAYTAYLAHYANGRALKLATPCIAAVNCNTG